MSKLTKLTKKLRHQLILEALKEKQFDRYKLAKKCHVQERTIRRDLNEIAESMGPIEERRLIVKQMALDELPPRIPKMSDRNIITLAMAGEPQRLEAKTEIKEEVKKEYTFNFDEMPEDERKLIKHAIRVYLKGRSETRPPSVR